MSGAGEQPVERDEDIEHQEPPKRVSLRFSIGAGLFIAAAMLGVGFMNTLIALIAHTPLSDDNARTWAGLIVVSVGSAVTCGVIFWLAQPLRRSKLGKCIVGFLTAAPAGAAMMLFIARGPDMSVTWRIVALAALAVLCRSPQCSDRTVGRSLIHDCISR